MVEQRTAPASLAGFSLLHVDALVGQAPGDRLIDAVDGPGNPAARGARFGDNGSGELGADAVPLAAGIAGAPGRDQLIELVFSGLAIARDAEVKGIHVQDWGYRRRTFWNANRRKWQNNVVINQDSRSTARSQ